MTPDRVQHFLDQLEASVRAARQQALLVDLSGWALSYGPAGTYRGVRSRTQGQDWKERISAINTLLLDQPVQRESNCVALSSSFQICETWLQGFVHGLGSQPCRSLTTDATKLRCYEKAYQIGMANRSRIQTAAL
jgi:hypothetical protein